MNIFLNQSFATGYTGKEKSMKYFRYDYRWTNCYDEGKPDCGFSQETDCEVFGEGYTFEDFLTDNIFNIVELVVTDCGDGRYEYIVRTEKEYMEEDEEIEDGNETEYNEDRYIVEAPIPCDEDGDELEDDE